MRSEHEIKEKLLKIIEYQKVCEKDTFGYALRDGYIDALEWVLQEGNQ